MRKRSIVIKLQHILIRTFAYKILLSPVLKMKQRGGAGQQRLVAVIWAVVYVGADRDLVRQSTADRRRRRISLVGLFNLSNINDFYSKV